MDPVLLTILGLEVHHPASVVTNVLLALQCGWLGARIPSGMASRLWRGFFWCLAVGAAFGALKHGFPWLEPRLYDGVRFISNVGLGAAVAMAQLAVVRKHTDPGAWRTAFSGLALAQFSVLLAWSVRSQDFLIPALDLAIGMGPVLVVESVAGLGGRISSRWVAAGLAAALVGGGLYAAEMAPGPWFNHVDLAHLVLMGTVALVFRGVASTRPPNGAGGASWS